MNPCDTFHRCNRCLKLNYKLKAKQYQEYRRWLWEEAGREEDGVRMLLTEGQVNTLLNLRVKVGRAYRRWKRGAVLPPLVETPCGCCRKLVSDEEVMEFCWYCHAMLCGDCWEEYGHCGHQEADEANEKACSRDS